MTILPIIVAPDPRLKIKSEPIEKVDGEIRTLMEDMLETMYAANGIGLAAVQVGVAKRIIVIDIAREDEDPNPLCLVNPEIIWLSDDDQLHEEGCLSLPEQYSDVVRPGAAKIRYLDMDNEIREFDVEDLMGVCVQHEMDHLDGVLFVDHISALKRNIILRKLTKIKKQEAAGS